MWSTILDSLTFAGVTICIWFQMASRTLKCTYIPNIKASRSVIWTGHNKPYANVITQHTDHILFNYLFFKGCLTSNTTSSLRSDAVLFCLVLIYSHIPQCLGKCLVHNKNSLNSCWWMLVYADTQITSKNGECLLRFLCITQIRTLVDY